MVLSRKGRGLVLRQEDKDVWKSFVTAFLCSLSTLCTLERIRAAAGSLLLCFRRKVKHQTRGAQVMNALQE